MLLLTIEDEDFIFASLKPIGLFLSSPNKTVKFNTFIYQGKGIKLGVGTILIFDKAVSTKSHTQTFSCQSSVMTKGKNLPLTYSQATAFSLTLRLSSLPLHQRESDRIAAGRAVNKLDYKQSSFPSMVSLWKKSF